MEDEIDLGDVRFILVCQPSLIVNREQIWGDSGD